MRPIVPAIAGLALIAGPTATVFAPMQPAPESPPTVRIACAGDPRNPYADEPDPDAVGCGFETGSVAPSTRPGSVVAGQRGAAEGMER